MRAEAWRSIVGPYVRQNALVSTRYTTINILRTIEAVLGLEPLGLNDALAMPMADVFDPARSQWSYRAEAADVLRTTQLPIPADRFVAEAIVCVNLPRSQRRLLGRGNERAEFRQRRPSRHRRVQQRALAGPRQLAQSRCVRDARDLRQDRRDRIKDIKPAACASPTNSIPGRY